MDRPTTNGDAERGYAMGSLLVALAIMSIMLSMALPQWTQVAKRAREAELVFRGEQYVRAVELYQRTYAATYPPDIETLVEERFLRRQYADPMTDDGEFRVVYESEAAELLGDTPTSPLPGQGVGRPGFGSDSDDSSMVVGEDEAEPGAAGSRPVLQLDDRPPAEGTRGGIVGVVSRSDDESLMIYNGATKYNEWAFIYSSSTADPGLGPSGAPPSGPTAAPVPGSGLGGRPDRSR